MTLLTTNVFGDFKCGQHGDGSWSPWSNWDCPIASFFRKNWKVYFYIVYDTIEDESPDSNPRCNFSMRFEHGKSFNNESNVDEPHSEQIAAALWAKENALLIESRSHPVLQSIIARYVSILLQDWIDPERAAVLNQQLRQRGFGTTDAVFRMTHPFALRFFPPLLDDRVIFSIQFDWSCDDEHYPVLYFDKERLITHNHLNEDEWKDALAAEGLRGYR